MSDLSCRRGGRPTDAWVSGSCGTPTATVLSNMLSFMTMQVLEYLTPQEEQAVLEARAASQGQPTEPWTQVRAALGLDG